VQAFSRCFTVAEHPLGEGFVCLDAAVSKSRALGGRKDGVTETKLLKSGGRLLLRSATASGCACLFYLLTSFLLIPARFFFKNPVRRNLGR